MSRATPPESLSPALLLLHPGASGAERPGDKRPEPPPPPSNPPFAAGVALGRREGRAQITALVLSLRRRAEAEVQEQLRRVRAHLEHARRGEAQAQRQLEQARQKFQALTAALGPASSETADRRAAPVPIASAQLLSRHAARLKEQRQLVRQRQQELDTQSEQVHTLLRKQSELHEALRRALALREAAELHESAELREQRRTRAQRQRTIEEEARDRFLSAQRQTRSPR